MSGVSIVVVSLVGGDALARVLDGLARQMQTVESECIVLTREQGNALAALQQQFASMRFVERGGRAVPQARQHGLTLAQYDVVALLEDSSLPAEDWLQAVAQAFSHPECIAAGGPVTVAAGLAPRYQALACTEYGRFAPQAFAAMQTGQPAPTGLTAVARLPGNNLAYRKSRVLPFLQSNDEGLIEGVLNAWLQQQGEALMLAPAMQVCYSHADRHGGRLATRFQHGRLYAGKQAVGQGAATRFVWALKSLLLPLVLGLRGAQGMRKLLPASRWPSVLLWTGLMETAWAAGEFTGYVSGAGRSLEAWQ